jgi:hypothetical protein
MAAAAVTGGVVDVVVNSGHGHGIPSIAVNPTTAGFRSRPELRPPRVTATAAAAAKSSGGTDPGFLLLGPGPVSLSGSEQFGPMIVDHSGELVWFSPLTAGLEVTNFTTAEYRGEPVLAWWQGKVLPSGYGSGEAVVVDRSYREIARIRAANGRSMDMHALSLTRAGTALFTCYPESVPADLSALGGPKHGTVYQSILQEVDIATGKLRFEWRSLEHVPLADSHEPISATFDYLHPNSIDQLPDGNLLVSGRHTWALYKLERGTGEVMWTLGGKRTQFGIGPGVQFAWQHDAQQHADGTFTVFDNGAAGRLQTQPESRGLVLDVDETARTVSLRRAYTSPQRLLAGAMGSVQALPSGRVLVGWGTESHTSEFESDGSLLLDYALPGGMYSYRGLWRPWKGIPYEAPSVAAGQERRSGRPLVYASWNGATDVTGWLVEAGPSRARLHPLGIAERRGFETMIPLSPQLRFAAVTPVDRNGNRLSRSRILKL